MQFIVRAYNNICIRSYSSFVHSSTIIWSCYLVVQPHTTQSFGISFRKLIKCTIIFNTNFYFHRVIAGCGIHNICLLICISHFLCILYTKISLLSMCLSHASVPLLKVSCRSFLIASLRQHQPNNRRITHSERNREITFSRMCVCVIFFLPSPKSWMPRKRKPTE